MPNRKKAKAKTTSSRRKIDLKKARIVIVAKDNPRRPGTTAYKRFDALRKAKAKLGGKAPARALMKASGYRGDDLNWDREHGSIKLVG